jgi:hypothetical protein
MAQGMLKLLENNSHVSTAKNVPRQEKNRDSVDGGAGRCSHHIGSAGTDRCCTCEGTQPAALLRKRRCDMNHSLFVPREIVREFSILFKGLPQSGYITMTKYSQHPSKKWMTFTVSLNPLCF